MTDAVIVSTARTPMGKACRGAFNNLEAPTLASVPIAAAVERAGVDPVEVDDVIISGGVNIHPGEVQDILETHVLGLLPAGFLGRPGRRPAGGARPRRYRRPGGFPGYPN